MNLLFYDKEIPQFLKGVEHRGGGACVRQYAIARGLSALGHRVGILTWKGANKFVDRDDFGFELVESFQNKGGIPFLKWFYQRLPSMYKAGETFKPDFIFQKAAAVPTGIIALIAKWLNVPFVYMATSDKDSDQRYQEVLDGFGRKAYRYGLKRASMIICQNNYQWEMFSKQFPDKKLLLMHNPFYSDFEWPELLPKSDRQYIAWVANFTDVKNLPALLQVTKSLPDLEFRIVGEIRPRATDVTKEALKELKERPNVKFMGFMGREDILPFLAQAYALLNTSILEGFTNTFLEAFAAGTPIVTRSAIDPDGIINKNQLGAVVEDYEDLPGGITSIINSENYDQMAARSRHYVKEHHDPENLTKKMTAALQELADQRN